MSRTTIGATLAALALAAAFVVLVVPADAAPSRVGVGFNAPAISGFLPGGKVFLTGGGSHERIQSRSRERIRPFERRLSLSRGR